QYGQLLLGRQDEMMADYVGMYTAVPLLGGIETPHPADLDNTGIDFRINSAIRYNSPNIGGFTGSALYSGDSTTGTFGQSSTKSFGLNYNNGGLNIAGAYTSVGNPSSLTDALFTSPSNPIAGYGYSQRYQAFGLATLYDFGNAKLGFNWTNTKFLGLDKSATGATNWGGVSTGHVSFNTFEILGTYNFTASLVGGLFYNYTDGAISATRQEPRYHTVGATLDYFLSKRTDVYVLTTYMKAAGDAQYAALLPTVGASSSSSQAIFRIGVRHKF
ncbi:MAG TPA: porin, partial [Bordetella sp.]